MLFNLLLMKNIGIDRFVLGFAGSLVLISLFLSSFFYDKFIYLAWFASFMMLQSAFTKFCPIAWFVKKLGFKSVNFF